jgi:hypothetical protein
MSTPVLNALTDRELASYFEYDGSAVVRALATRLLAACEELEHAGVRIFDLEDELQDAQDELSELQDAIQRIGGRRGVA